MNPPTLCFITLLLFVGGLLAEESPLSSAKAFLEENSLHTKEIVAPANYEEIRQTIAADRDPESQFGRLLFALARPGTKVLSKDQLVKVADLIAARQAAPVNWHDVRNIVRVQAMLLLFPHAIASDPAEVARVRSEWEAWTDLRQAYMLQEFVAQERFQRAFWAILTPEQKQQIIAGELDSKYKKSTGHSRGFFADRIVTRALGKPDHPDAFESATSAWRAKWEQVQESMEQQARFNRQREFAMDTADESFAVASWPDQAQAFREFAEAERDAIRDLVQAGYGVNDALKEKVALLMKTQRAEMREKYRDHGSDLLHRMGETEGE
tara:strand:+ start:386 stop:1357 length:972 start_codon:yes stop_codon:yes gene_type:complete